MEALTTVLLVTIATAYIMATLKMFHFLFKFKHSQIQYNSTLIYCKNKQVDSYTTTNKHVSEEHLECFLYEALSKAHGIISN